jgi:hypothetical protein
MQREPGGIKFDGGVPVPDAGFRQGQIVFRGATEAYRKMAGCPGDARHLAGKNL